MTYWALNTFFLAAVAVVGIAALIVRWRRRVGGVRAAGVHVLDVVLPVGVLLAMTAFFDNLMIYVQLVGYDPAKISGVKIGIAPLEDFAYAIAALVLLPSLWVLLERRPR